MNTTNRRANVDFAKPSWKGAMIHLPRLDGPDGRPSAAVFEATAPAGLMIVDVETTGLDAGIHSLVEIGGRLPNGHLFKTSFRPRPGSALDAEALEVNGGSPESFDRRETPWIEGVSAFFRWVASLPKPAGGRWIMAGLNCAGLDLPFLRRAWSLLGRNPRWFPFSHRVYDLHTAVIDLHILAGHEYSPDLLQLSNEAISDFLKIPREAKPHTALTGINWTAEAFARCFSEMGACARYRKHGEQWYGFPAFTLNLPEF